MMDDLATSTERLTAMEGSHFWTTGRDHLVDLLIDRYHSGSPLVDAGSGTGAFAASLAERLDDEVLWFDVEPTAAPVSGRASPPSPFRMALRKPSWRGMS